MRKIVIVGGSSLLGYKLSKIISEFEVFSTFYKNQIKLENVKTLNVNIVEKESCEKIEQIGPDIIINAAALTNVDYCESFEKEAFNVNVKGTKNLVEIAESMGSKMIQISSDAIFSGNKKKYVEDDEPNPINIYGKTKLKSEEEIRKISNYLILRPSVIFGWIPFNHLESRDNSVKKMNFGLWVLKKLYEKQKISVVTDQFSSPTLADNLAENILEFIEKDFSGTYHVSGLTCISRLDFARSIAREFGYKDELIESCTTGELNQIANRSVQSCLNCDKAVRSGINLLNLEQAIKRMSEQIRNEFPQIFGNVYG